MRPLRGPILGALCALLLILAGCGDDDTEPPEERTEGGGGGFCANEIVYNGVNYRGIATDPTGTDLPSDLEKGKPIGRAQTHCADLPRTVKVYEIEGLPPATAIYVSEYGGTMVPIDDPRNAQ